MNEIEDYVEKNYNDIVARLERNIYKKYNNLVTYKEDIIQETIMLALKHKHKYKPSKGDINVFIYLHLRDAIKNVIAKGGIITTPKNSYNTSNYVTLDNVNKSVTFNTDYIIEDDTLLYEKFILGLSYKELTKKYNMSKYKIKEKIKEDIKKIGG